MTREAAVSEERNAPKPGRDRFGKFVKGNGCARSHGMFAKVALEPEERKRATRVRKRLEDAGVDRDSAELLSVSWVGAERMIGDFLSAKTPRERVELFGLYERACAIARSVLRRRDRALGLSSGEDDGDDLARALEQATRGAGGGA